MGTFSSTANSVNNKFLNHEGIAASDGLPGVCPIPGTLVKLTFTNQTPDGGGITGTVEIRKNASVGTPDDTAVLADSRTQSITISIVVAAEDFITVKLVNATNVSKPVMKLYY